MASAKLFLGLLVALSTGNFVLCQSNFNTTGNFRGERYASIIAPRGMIVDDSGDILVVSERGSSITAFYLNATSIDQALILSNTQLRLNHGIAYNNGWLYASSQSTVYRWRYTPGQRTSVTTAEEIVLKNMPTGGHVTRTLVFDKNGLLYAHVGSNRNVDPNSERARIRRFNISTIPSGGIEFSTGVVFADGLRNEVGLNFDGDGILWGVQNGADNLFRADLGGDIHNTNPADEMTKFDQAVGTHYGYPYCWTVDELEGHSSGDQFAWPDFMNDGVHTDAWCKDVRNNRPPTLPLPAHNAALGITFYDASVCAISPGSFPCEMMGDAFVALHGSWNREPPQGYKVVRIPIDFNTKLPTGEIIDVLYEPDPVDCSRCLRPVNVVFDHRGHLIVSSDTSNELIRVTYDPNNDSFNPSK